jgi:arylformamidase
VVRQAVSISGLFDLAPIAQTPFLQESLHLTPEHVRQASPAYLPAPKGKVLHALVGGDESAEFLRQNRLIAHKWGTDVVPTCETLAGCHHFSVLDEWVRHDAKLHQQAMQWLNL